MRRFAETVLDGHPDKFCDLVAEGMILAMNDKDPEGYGQVEASVWSDQLFLTGMLISRTKLDIDVCGVVNKIGMAIGYTPDNHIDVGRYVIHNHICQVQADPSGWTNHVNDQCVVTGYAGYDRLTDYLPPEQHICRHLREALIQGINRGLLQGQGPDGKLLIVMQEEPKRWSLNKLLVTLQQKETASFTEITERTNRILHEAYVELQQKDRRWTNRWEEIEVIINPNGPFVQGGSDGDNGQTGRKLVMDFYGPRIPLGGGALYGKALTHIDRLASIMARNFAVSEVKRGAREVRVNLCYAPGVDKPLMIDISSDIRPQINPEVYFGYKEMCGAIKRIGKGFEFFGVGN